MASGLKVEAHGANWSMPIWLLQKLADRGRLTAQKRENDCLVGRARSRRFRPVDWARDAVPRRRSLSFVRLSFCQTEGKRHAQQVSYQDPEPQKEKIQIKQPREELSHGYPGARGFRLELYMEIVVHFEI